MHNKDTHALIKVLRENGHSATKSRLFVFNLLWHQPPFTMAELWSKANGHIDRASLYRAISLFNQLGITHRVNLGWKYKIELAEQFSHHHHHLSCSNCGRMIAAFESNVIEDEIHKIAARYSIKITSHQVEIQGHCSECQKI